jgi:hypothetical protein
MKLKDGHSVLLSLFRERNGGIIMRLGFFFNCLFAVIKAERGESYDDWQ